MDQFKEILKHLAITVQSINERQLQASRNNTLSNSILAAFCRASIKAHPDPGALRQEWDFALTELLHEVGEDELRDAPLAISLQRVIHSAFDS
ncbi:hypothetical protein INQ40_00650 [Lysobacter sp. H21R4]|uniref:hypothetical protein n=1 Tax=Lysobacter sp. H21R4 TaxID=2781021 RepID=UPI001887D218|nr:hypothetical protein [Lysobacter sp. H21R4]QOY62865.1 hypothetical protein INQ40_00650 [Lysobacter sp. H21R4]